MTTLALNNVSKSYDAENVLSDVNFEVADGEMIVIVGPSGCGKSSLLRMVAGLEPITAGEVLINGQVVNKVEPKDRDIAMVFQNYALYPHMTVFANMAYGLKLRGLSVDAIKKRVTETALLLGLENLLERKPAALSGGQRQRVAMGRAILPYVIEFLPSAYAARARHIQAPPCPLSAASTERKLGLRMHRCAATPTPHTRTRHGAV